MDSGTDERRRETLLRRLTSLGLSPREVAGGESFAVTLTVGRKPFALPDGRSLALADVALVTVGDDRMKCITPRVLFALPLFRWIDCNDAAAIEARLRERWQAHLDTVVASKRWLGKLCIEATDDAHAPLASFPLGLDDTRVRALVQAPGRVALPTRGPLSGVTLLRAEDRVFDVVSSLASGVDLQIAVTTRMEELARLDARLARANARDVQTATTAAPASSGTNTLRRTDPDDPRRILLVGTKLIGETALHESLRLRGLEVILARSANDALRVFDTRSPEFVLTETRLDRFEGIELIHALRALPGIEDIPVVLLDDHARPELRETARRAGAGGYLVRPLDPPRFAAALAEQVRRPRRRRFTRHALQIHVRAASNGAMATTSDLGRGGMLVWSDEGTPVADIDRWMIRLPGAGESVEVEAATVHRRSRPGEGRQGAGLRFRRFTGDGEARLLSWLARLREEARAPLD